MWRLRRIVATMVLTTLLVGVPALVIGVIGLPLPSIEDLRTLAIRRRLDDRSLVHVGTIVFAVLWGWFALSMLAEFAAIVRWRRSDRRYALPAVSPGPTRWVRHLVRVAAVSGMSASVMLVPTTVDAHSANEVVRNSTVSAPAVGTAVHIPAAVPERSVASSQVAGLGAAMLLAGGALILLDAYRRQRLRASVVGARLDLPSLERVRTELTLRLLGAEERLARLDIAVRSAAPLIDDAGASLFVVIAGHTGEIRILPSRSVSPNGVWRVERDGWMVVSAAVSTEELAHGVRSDAPPCPALVHLGRATAGECFVDLESLGVLFVDLTEAEPVLRAVTESLRVSPFLESARVIDVGIDAVAELESLDAALDMATGALGPVGGWSGEASLFEQRVRSAGGEAWEPVVVVASCPTSVEELRALQSIALPGRGVGVILHDLSSRDHADSVERRWSLRDDVSGAVLEPIGLRLRPVAVSSGEVAAVRDLVAGAAAPIEIAAPVLPIDVKVAEPEPFVEPEWSFLVRIFGPVEVMSRDGITVQFERSKALELIVWLTLHRTRPTRGAARAALWDLDVRDATFANVVSEARRALARALEPPEGDEWIARTLTDALPLHRGVVTDADLLAARVCHAQGLEHRQAIEVLTPGVELLVGLPFAGTGYLWSDAEGLSSSLVLQAVGAATTLAMHHLAVGDVEGVFWATGQGLRVLSGHEELIALRMRAHAGRGDLAGVRVEWERYERSLASDPWSTGEPSPKLAELRRELLGSGLSRVRGSNP